jgi:hypothetical protein
MTAMSDQNSLPQSAAADVLTSKPASTIRRFQAIPLLRHMRLWQKLLSIVVVLLIPNLFLLKDFVSRASEDIVRTRSELCLDQHSHVLRVILQHQAVSLAGSVAPQVGAPNPGENARAQVENALAELGRLQASGCGRANPEIAVAHASGAGGSAQRLDADLRGGAGRDRSAHARAVAIGLTGNWPPRTNLGSAADSDSELVNQATRSLLPEAAWRLADLVVLGGRLPGPRTRPSRRGCSSSMQ